MATQRMITVAAEDVHTMVVGSLADFQHKLRMANDVEYQEEQRVASYLPTTFQAMFGNPPASTMRTALGL